MSSIKKEDFAKSLIYLFQETLEGSPKEGSIYLDRGVGVLNTIGDLTAEDASKSIGGGSIAAHTEHLRYYLEVLNNFIKGTVQIADWSKSWNIKEVNEEEWNLIKEAIEKEYKVVLETIENHENWSQDAIIQATAIVVHTGYHLGAIRQIAKTVADKQIAIGGEH